MGLIGLKIATKWGYLVSSLTLGGGYPSRATPPGYPPGWPPGGGWAPPEPTPVNREGWHFSPGTPGIRGGGQGACHLWRLGVRGAGHPGSIRGTPGARGACVAPGILYGEFYIENSTWGVLYREFFMENSLLVPI